MAIDNSTPTNRPFSAIPQKKKEGSGFVNFDRVTQENQQASQALGNKISTGIGQQVQAAQGQVQGQVQNVQGQVQQENQRLGQATGQVLGQPTVPVIPGAPAPIPGTTPVQPVSVVGQLQADPSSVNKQQYQDLTSGRINKADTQELAGSQNKLGSTAQVAQQLSTSPQARQQAIQQTTNRPLAMQGLNSLQKNLDSMLLGRNVNTQDIANKTARASFNLDRTVGKELGNVEKAAQGQQAQAIQNQNILRGTRLNVIDEQQKQGEAAANKYNTETKGYLDYLNSDQLSQLLGGEGVITGGKLKLDDPAQQEKLGATPAATPQTAARDRFLTELLNQGIDPNALDITDLGTTGAVNLIRQGQYGATPVTAEQSLTDPQRARLKALYNLEDETQGKNYLDEKFVQAKAGTDLSKLKESSAASAAATAAAKAKYDAGVTDFNANYDRVLANPYMQGNTDPSRYGTLANILSTSLPDYQNRVDTRVSELAGGKRVGDLNWGQTELNNAKEQAQREIYDQVSKSPEGRQSLLATMEQASKQNFDQSVTIDDIGKVLYGGGGAAGMAAVRDAFNPYIQRKVLTLGGGTLDQGLQGGAYKGSGLGKHNLEVNQSGGNLFQGIGTNLARIGEMAGSLTSASNPVGNLVRNVAGVASGGLSPMIWDEIKKRQLASAALGTVGAVAGTAFGGPLGGAAGSAIGSQIGSGIDKG